MMRHTTLGSILLLAVTCIMAARADTVIEFDITKMDWTYVEGPLGMSGTTTLKVCRATDFADPESVILEVSPNPPGVETPYLGAVDTDPKCAVFSVDGDVLPDSTERIYKLVFETTAGGTERGSITYSMTYPVFKLSCYEIEYVRLSMVTGHLTADSCPASSSSDTPPLSICYARTDTGTVCANQLDTNSPNTIVCVPIPPTTASDATPTTSTVKALSYANKLLTATDPTVSEMLIRKYADAPTDFTLEFCTNAVCPVPDTFTVGEDKYELCFVNSVSGVTGVAKDEFQDLSLAALPSKTSVDLRFLNLNPDRKYLIYKTTNADAVEPVDQNTINLDCSNINLGSYCYGFFESEDGITLPDFIAISYDDADKSNVIISPSTFPASSVEQKS
ncbi:uncharacterized protein LOC108674712 isoform X2 [Hyalella azteca]|uniref:Uncharacterized protein LOC108674712 isoform X2 n=1 Tax=Hyalella azteca TaxID=294128 RepID=A0A8B7NWM9_HYAAZ|nr:uncharacterized protein LOC108674712 isoform X2 [Hyalella azteca]